MAGGVVITGTAYTATDTVPVLVNAPSLATNRSEYVPFVENVADVFATLAFPKLTGPGPLAFDHNMLNVPFGAPSSVTVAFKFTMTTGNVIGVTGAILTCGGVFPSCVMVSI